MDIKKIIKCQNTIYKFVASLAKDAVVLDVGAGNGLMQKKLSEYRQDIKFISVDKKDFSQNFPDGVFVKADVTKDVLPLESKTIDAVICCHLLEHLSSYDLLLSEIKRIIRPNGSVYIVAPSTRSLYLPSIGFSRGQDAPINFFDDPTHLRPFTRQSLHRIGMKLGFKKIRTGFVRNWLYCLLTPIILPYSIIKKDRQMFTTILWNLTGWCIYLWGENIDK